MSTIDGENIHQSFNEMITCASQFALLLAIPLWFAKLISKLNRKFERALKIMNYYAILIINDEQKRKGEKNDFYSFERNKTLIRL